MKVPPIQGVGRGRESPAPRAADRPSRPTGPKPAPVRFREADAYRAQREWDRYEGTSQRDLFRVLRERFLDRHRRVGRWVLDAGAGPGRFTRRLGTGPAVRRVALDISIEMLRRVVTSPGTGDTGERPPERVLGDARSLPFAPSAFDVVAAMGNLLGFAEGDSEVVLDRLIGAVAPGGTLLIEVAPGPGERSRYLRRLPPGSVARLFRSAPTLVAGRVVREGFAREPRRRAVAGEFRRLSVKELTRGLESRGMTVTEVLAVAPGLGADADRASSVAKDSKAWAHLLEVEERLGADPERWEEAASILLAAQRPEVPGAPASPAP